MDTDDRAYLQAQCAWLEHELLAIERALDDRALAAGHPEQLRLTACQQPHLAELGAVNARLSALRDSAAPT